MLNIVVVRTIIIIPILNIAPVINVVITRVTHIYEWTPSIPLLRLNIILRTIVVILVRTFPSNNVTQ